jgi:integrase
MCCCAVASIPSPDKVTPDTPLRLGIAAALAFPDGSMTAAGLRREADRGRLVIERIAGRDYVTLAAIEDMRKLCRVDPKVPDSGSNRSGETMTARSASGLCGSSETERVRSARARLQKIARAPSSDYLADKYQPSRTRGRSADQILIADVLQIYLEDIAHKHGREYETKQRVLALDAWWGDRTLADVTGKTCRDYVKHRTSLPWKSSRPESTGRPPRMVTTAAPRRELADLRAAINHHRREGLCSEVVSVLLPESAPARERWLTRSEAARLLWAAWRARHAVPGRQKKRAVGKHVARFILVGLYTGSRSAAICSAALAPAIGRGHVDLEHGVFYRRAAGERETKKRQPAVRLPPRLIAHLRRWQRLGIAKHAVVEWDAKPVKTVRKSFAAAARAAGLGREVTPHILRHTCATWLMQNGADRWHAAGFLGMTMHMLERVYGHHHPDHQASAIDALGRQDGDRLTMNKARQTSSSVIKIA